MVDDQNEARIPSGESMETLEAFFAHGAFQRYLLKLGREDDRFDSLNSIVRANRRTREFLEEDEYPFVFLWQRELGLMALKYLLWDENELSRGECATIDAATVVRRSVEIECINADMDVHLTDVFEYDLFRFDPEKRPFESLERLEADERLERVTNRIHRVIEERIEDTFDELKGT